MHSEIRLYSNPEKDAQKLKTLSPFESNQTHHLILKMTP
uniref:Uncharacterized protein n=1 Tax=Anguilla anguilla TaxID=7936 RepID=A0A0E9UX97_ANGAN